MGKTKTGIAEELSLKRHKKHKRHKHKKKTLEPFLSLSSPDGATVSTGSQPSIKLKIKIGGETISAQSYTVTSDKDGHLDGTSYSLDGNMLPDDEEAMLKDKDTSDEEREWLNALEAGELDDNGELKKEKDTSLLTTRQKALLHGERIEELHELILNAANQRPTILTEEQKNRKQLRAKRRREEAEKKTEKDKQETLERLLKKQDSKMKVGSNKNSNKEKNFNIPTFKYLNNSETITVSVPIGFQFPLLSKAPIEPKPIMLCGVENCQNPKKYSCSKTGVPICSLDCYRRNLEHQNDDVTNIDTNSPASTMMSSKVVMVTG